MHAFLVAQAGLCWYVLLKGPCAPTAVQPQAAPDNTGGPATSIELTEVHLLVSSMFVQVVHGFDVVQAVASLPFARPRDSYYDKPFFEAGKALGDKRATVAEKRFNRPLKRVLVANAGVL